MRAAGWNLESRWRQDVSSFWWDGSNLRPPMETGPAIKEDGVPERKNRTHSFRFPPGFRFNPKDEELIVYYLNRKIEGQPLPYDIFNDVELYDHSPEELAEMCDFSGEERLYFFTPRLRKYPKGSRPARAAGGGYWKVTGSGQEIFADRQLVGVKKNLVYYKGKGEKTDWTMQEYMSKLARLSIHKPGGSMKLDNWVLCCLHKKRGAIDNPNKLLKVSQAQADMPIEQAADNNGSYQTSIDQNGEYGAIMAQLLAASPSGQIIGFNGMEQSSAVAPSVQMIDFNRGMQPLAADYGEPMANFSCTAQETAIFLASREQMIHFSGRMQPSAADYTEPMANFSCTAQKQMIDFSRRMQPSAADDGEPMANFSCTAQKIATSPAEPMTNFSSMAQPFVAAPIAPVTEFNNMEQPFAMESSTSATFHNGMPQILGVVPDESIVDFSAMRWPSPCSPMMEPYRIMSINNNHSTGQGFQQNFSHAMPCSGDLLDMMAYDERDEVTALWSVYPSMEQPSNKRIRC